MKNKGVTLIELLVVLVILSVVLGAVYQSYLNVLKAYTQQTTTAVSNIDRLIGAEIIRRDIELAGFGIPNDKLPLEYDEANNTLTISSTVSSRNDYTKCYGYADFNGKRFFTLDDAEISAEDCNDTNICYLALDLDYTQKFNCYKVDSSDPSKLLLLFGLSSNSTDNKITYELDDYNSEDKPLRCAQNTKVLRREDASTGGAQPILDCVERFKVAFGLDTDDDDIVDTWSTTLPSDPKVLRSQLKQVKVFIVYHEGRKDPAFNYSGGTIYLNTSNGTIEQFTPTGDDIHYRWKLFQFSVKPMNLKREIR